MFQPTKEFIVALLCAFICLLYALVAWEFKAIGIVAAMGLWMNLCLNRILIVNPTALRGPNNNAELTVLFGATAQGVADSIFWLHDNPKYANEVLAKAVDMRELSEPDAVLMGKLINRLSASKLIATRKRRVQEIRLPLMTLKLLRATTTAIRSELNRTDDGITLATP